MKKVRIWTPESDTDSRAVQCLAKKIVKLFNIEILITTASKSAYISAARTDDGLGKAVSFYLKQDDFVIFLLDYDGIQSHAARGMEPNSHINKITAVVNQAPEKTMLLYMCQELEAWLLIDCLGICCYFKNDKNEIIRDDQDWIKFAKRNQKGETDLIIEVERGGDNAKEYLMEFSHKIIKKINPQIKRKDVDQKEYKENMSDRVAEFILINQEVLKRNDSLKKFADLLCEIAQTTEEKPQ